MVQAEGKVLVRSPIPASPASSFDVLTESRFVLCKDKDESIGYVRFKGIWYRDDKGSREKTHQISFGGANDNTKRGKKRK